MAERRSNRLLRSSFVEIVNVAGVVLVDSEEIMGLHVAHKVGTDYHAATNFPLHTDVHLDRTRSAIVGIVHIRAQTVERSMLDWLSWNSWMPLAGMSVVVELNISFETSMPSTSIRAVRPKRPPKEMDE